MFAAKNGLEEVHIEIAEVVETFVGSPVVDDGLGDPVEGIAISS